jgi:hypothetical protein
VNWSIVIVVNPMGGPKFRPHSTHVTVSLSKFSCTAVALILKKSN